MRNAAALEPDIAATAALISDPSRARILQSLADGSSRPASELATLAGISPQTASSHLARLLEGGLVKVISQGRHRYYRLAGASVAALLESLALLAPPGGEGSRQRRMATDLRAGRTCYGHLAGQLGIAVTDGLVRRRYMLDEEGTFALAPAGVDWLRSIGVEGSDATLRARACVDWSERRYHLAGPAGVVLARRFFELGWLRRVKDTRVVFATAEGKAALAAALGLDL